MFLGCFDTTIKHVTSVKNDILCCSVHRNIPSRDRSAASESLFHPYHGIAALQTPRMRLTQLSRPLTSEQGLIRIYSFPACSIPTCQRSARQHKVDTSCSLLQHVCLLLDPLLSCSRQFRPLSDTRTHTHARSHSVTVAAYRKKRFFFCATPARCVKQEVCS